MSTEIKINEIDVQKLNMSPGEILVVKLKGNQFLNGDAMNSLQNGLASLLPNNKIVILGIPENHYLEMQVVSGSSESVGCGTEPSQYCGDCNCGKRETYEAAQAEKEMEEEQKEMEEEQKALIAGMDFLDSEMDRIDKEMNQVLTEDYKIDPQDVFKKMDFLKEQLGAMTPEEIQGLVDASLSNFGKPDLMLDGEGKAIVKDGNLTEHGIETMQKAYEEKQKKDGENK
jgi:hypothetical protein